MRSLALRAKAFQAKVLMLLGPRAAHRIAWNTRTCLPALLSFEPLRSAAARSGLRIERWLYLDGKETALEASHANWRPAVKLLARDPGSVPSVAASAAAFDQHVRPTERVQRTRSKYLTYRRVVLTWALWKGVPADVLPMSEELLRAFL